MDKNSRPAWFYLCEHDIRGFLRRAAAGEHPDLLMLEMLANAEDWSGKDDPPPCLG